MKEMEINIKKEIKTEIDNYFKEIKNNKKIFGEESLILTEEKEINFLTKFIKMIKPNSQMKLIYRASIDGQMGKDFHSKCDGVFRY